MSEELLTLRQLAQELGLPESTVRYYRDVYLQHIPSVGTGRRRRYPREAVAVLRSIAGGYGSGQSRGEIVAGIGGEPGSALAVPERKQPRGSHAQHAEDVSNLDLLAAILDGEREQRDALWQMAKEIVRLTEVLEGQDKVLTEIADKAGVTGALPRPPAPVSLPPAASVPLPPAPAAQPAPTPPPPSFVSTNVPKDAGSLREELEAERALVERLRVAKLQLEQRAADAEAALEEQRTSKRPSLVQRLMGNLPR